LAAPALTFAFAPEADFVLEVGFAAAFAAAFTGVFSVGLALALADADFEVADFTDAGDLARGAAAVFFFVSAI